MKQELSVLQGIGRLGLWYEFNLADFLEMERENMMEEPLRVFQAHSHVFLGGAK